MSDHYHDVSEVQGATPSGHGHYPRDLGAADQHDLDMLAQRVSQLEAQLREALRQNGELIRQYAALNRDHGELVGLTQELTGSVRSIGQSVNGLATAVERILT